MHDYRQQGILFSWIKKIPQVDRHWARVYLQRKGLSVQPNAFEGHSADTPFPDDAHHREIDSQLRNAWRQRKARRKLSGRKAYNFILTSSTKKKLDEIAVEMHSTVTEALRNFIENEHLRIKELNKKAQDFKASTKQLKEKNEEELKKSEQITNDIRKVLIATEYALYLQTMKLVFTQLQLENRLTQHAPPDALKEEVLIRFNTATQDIKNSLGPLSLGLPIRTLNTEEIWQKAIARDLK